MKLGAISTPLSKNVFKLLSRRDVSCSAFTTRSLNVLSAVSRSNALKVPTTLELRRNIHLTKRTEEVVTNPENAVWDPIREFHFKKYELFETLGLDYEDKEADEFMARYIMFFAVSIMSTGIFFWTWFKPSYMRVVHDWGKREAFRLIEEREAAGLPVIELDYAPPEELIPYLPPQFGMYTCDVESDFTWYNKIYQLYPVPMPIDWVGEPKPKIVGAFAEHQRVLNDGTKLSK